MKRQCPVCEKWIINENLRMHMGIEHGVPELVNTLLKQQDKIIVLGHELQEERNEH